MADLELDVDVLNGGIPADATASRWHVTPIGITVTVTRPPDSRIPCRLHLHATDAQRWLGQVLTLRRAAPVRETWLRARLVDVDDNPRPIIVLDHQADGTTTVHRTAPLPATPSATSPANASRRSPPTRRQTRPTHRPWQRVSNLDRLARTWPSVQLDAHHWLTDDVTLADLLADIIRLGLDQRQHRGAKFTPAPADARAELRHLTDAVRARCY